MNDSAVTKDTVQDDDISSDQRDDHSSVEQKEEEITDRFSYEYWTGRWHPEDRGWHKSAINPILESNIDSLINGRSHLRIFLPMCGMAIDMSWLADLGHSVVGVEFIESGVKAFFESNNYQYTVYDLPGIDGKLYKATGVPIEVYCCDYYDLTIDTIGQFEAIWDRGSLVAIDPSQRKRYSDVLLPLMAPGCRYLLSTFTFDKTKFDGPPCLVEESELQDLYGTFCSCEILDIVDRMTEKHKERGLDYFYEHLHLITPKR